MYRQFYLSYLDFQVSAQPSEEGFIAVRCPFHDDKTASAGLNVETGVFNCFKCGSFSPAHFLIKFLETDLETAHEIVSNYRLEHDLTEHEDTFVKHIPKSPKLDELYSIATFPETHGLITTYCQARGLTPQTLKECGVRFLPADKTSWKRDSLVFPYMIDGHVVGLRYRDILGNKGGEPGCHFTLFGLDDLDSETARVAVICEGESDRLRCYQALEALRDKVVVVGTPTATFMQEWDREFEGFNKVIVIPQSDEASLKMVTKAAKALGDKLEVLHLPWRRKQNGKDLCDWFKYHEEEELLGLIETICNQVNRDILTGEEFMMQARQPRQWLIKGILARRQVVVIAGQPKSFKTWFVLSWVRSLLTPGENLCGIPELVTEEENLRVLIVEEEGDAEELYQRASQVLNGTNWLRQTFWAHHLGIKLDESSWVDRIEKQIEAKEIDCLIIDPFQRVHSADENSATEMGTVWQSIHHFTTKFPKLSVILLHHYNKTGAIADGWGAFRGSSRTAAECDLGVFVERLPKALGTGIKVKFDGRSIPQICGEDGKDVFRLTFHPDTGRLILDTGKVNVSKWQALVGELEDRGSWELNEAAKFYGVSTTIIRGWVEKSKVPITISNSAPGKPCSLSLTEE